MATTKRDTAYPQMARWAGTRNCGCNIGKAFGQPCVNECSLHAQAPKMLLAIQTVDYEQSNYGQVTDATIRMLRAILRDVEQG